MDSAVLLMETDQLNQDTRRTTLTIIGVVLVALVFFVVYDPFGRDVVGQAFQGDIGCTAEGKFFVDELGDVGKCMGGKINPCADGTCAELSLDGSDVSSGSVCGDGVPDFDAGEECDDANTDDGDGCSSGCLNE